MVDGGIRANTAVLWVAAFKATGPWVWTRRLNRQEKADDTQSTACACVYMLMRARARTRVTPGRVGVWACWRVGADVKLRMCARVPRVPGKGSPVVSADHLQVAGVEVGRDDRGPESRACGTLDTAYGVGET